MKLTFLTYVSTNDAVLCINNVVNETDGFHAIVKIFSAGVERQNRTRRSVTAIDRAGTLSINSYWTPNVERKSKGSHVYFGTYKCRTKVVRGFFSILSFIKCRLETAKRWSTFPVTTCIRSSRMNNIRVEESRIVNHRKIVYFRMASTGKTVRIPRTACRAL